MGKMKWVWAAIGVIVLYELWSYFGSSQGSTSTTAS